MFQKLRRAIMWRLMNRLAEISVGHGLGRVSLDGKPQSMVILNADGTKVFLSPDGAREIAKQLTHWADYTERQAMVMEWEPLRTMQWIVRATWNEIAKDHSVAE